MDSGVKLLEASATEGQLRHLAPGATWYLLEVGEDQTQKGLFESVRRSLPQDPPLGRYRDVWEALDDSVWGGLAEAHPAGGEAVVYWRDAFRMRSADRAAYDLFVEIFGNIAESLGNPRYNPAPLRLLVLLADASL